MTLTPAERRARSRSRWQLSTSSDPSTWLPVADTNLADYPQIDTNFVNTAQGGSAYRSSGNAFMRMLDWLFGFSRIGTQTIGGIVQGLETGQWDFDFNWWRYNDSEDTHRALRSGAGIIGNALAGASLGGGIGAFAGGVNAIPGAIAGAIVGGATGLAQVLMLGLIPDTPEQAAESLRETAARLKARTDNPFISKAVEALPWLSGFWNEQTMAEMAFDPLSVVGVLQDFGIGAKIAQGIQRSTSVGRMTSWVGDLPYVSGLADWTQKQFLGVPARRMRELSQTAGSQVALEFSEFDIQTGHLARAFKDMVGAEVYLQVTPVMSDIIEATPQGIRIAEEVAQEAVMQALDLDPLTGLARRNQTPFGQEILQGASERYEYFLKSMQDQFPDLPAVAHEFAARYMGRNVNTSALTQAFENIKGIPTPAIDDIQYLYHLTTKGHSDALFQAVGEMSGEAREIWYKANHGLRNILGRNATETLKRRNIRERLSIINDMQAGYIKGSPELLLYNRGAELPEGFIPIVGKLFEDDPFLIEAARAARSVRAVTALDFLKEAGQMFGTTEAKAGAYSIKGAIEGAEWDRTFGRLDESIQDLASNTYFPDKATAKSVLRQFQSMRNIERKPLPFIRSLARYKRMWAALTLTPFTSSINRNLIGGVFVHEQRYGVSGLLSYIEAALKLESNDPILFEFAKRRLYLHNQIEEIMRQGGQLAEMTPLATTPLKSVFKALTSKKGLAPWKIGDEGTYANKLRATDVNDEFWGRSAYSYVDNLQRTASAIEEMRRGATIDEAVTRSITLHFDYGDMPQWYKNLNPILAFPTWSIKMVPLQFKMLMQNPAYFARRGRLALASQQATGFTPAETPEMIREGGGFGVPAFRADKPMWIRPENFDPLAIFSDLSDPLKFGYDMFNPIITEPIEQLRNTRRMSAGYGASVETVPSMPYAPGSQPTGFDPFLNRAIVRDYTTFNEALPIIGGEKMPAWAQRADHAMRSFLRFYSEFSSAQKIIAENAGHGEGLAELAGRRTLGIPIYWQDMNESMFFNLRGINQRIAAEETRGQQNLPLLKNLYLNKLAVLAHGTFAQQDPFTGELRHWADYGSEGKFPVTGRRDMWQEGIETIWLLLYGARHPSDNPILDPPIPLDSTEEEYLEGLLHRLLDTYTIELSQAEGRGETSYGRSMEYVEDRRNALQGGY